MRKICPGVYTSDLVRPLEQITRPNWREITEHLYPGALIAYRSAELAQPDAQGNIFLVLSGRAQLFARNLAFRAFLARQGCVGTP